MQAKPQFQHSVLALLIFLFSALNLKAQDSIQTLNAQELLSIIKTYHPIVKQADISINKASADVRIARANFDPVFKHYNTNKAFSGINYYDFNQTELKIPTWYGLELVGGMQNLSGSNTNPTQTLGENSYVGLNVSLLKNLRMDHRRATLKQAKIFRELAEIQQRQIINDLSIEAMETYWNWVKSYQYYVIIKNNADIVKQRLRMMNSAFKNGEVSAIDTTEALSQLQSFQIKEQSAFLEFKNYGYKLSTFLWDKNTEPLELPSTVIPDSIWLHDSNFMNMNFELDHVLSIAQKEHPDLLVYNYKLSALEVEKKLKFQDLLPKLDLSYKHLAKGYNFIESPPVSVLQNNYQYNLSLEIPLRLSKGRGEFEKAKLKIQETELDLKLKNQQIEMKIRATYNQLFTLLNQIRLQTNQYNNLLLLVKAEETKLSNGESSIFLINNRELKALEAKQKLVDLKHQYFNSLYVLQWQAGLLQY
jgi:outer membrane protein TolC